MDEHDVNTCEDCSVATFEANGHSMRVIIPCLERVAYWACLSCDTIEKWPVTDDIKATNDIVNAMLYVHCIDNLVYS